VQNFDIAFFDPIPEPSVRDRRCAAL